MRICPKKATAALNLVAVTAVVCLYCLHKIAADPVAAMPDQPSPLQAPDRVVAKMPVDRIEAGINMTNIRLPAPPPVSAAMRSPQAAVSQPSAHIQALSSPTPAAEPARVPLIPQPAQVTTAPIMPMTGTITTENYECACLATNYRVAHTTNTPATNTSPTENCATRFTFSPSQCAERAANAGHGCQ